MYRKLHDDGRITVRCGRVVATDRTSYHVVRNIGSVTCKQCKAEFEKTIASLPNVVANAEGK